MNINVTGMHTEVSDRLREYATHKLGKLTRYFEHLQEAKVVFRVERQRDLGRAQIAEVTIWGDGIVLRGEEASPDMYASVDQVVEKLEKQIEKYRSRLIEKRRLDEQRKRRRRATEAARALAAADVVENGPRIVRRKRFPMKPMTEEEAILQMELLDHSFFVYRDAGTDRIHVVYRRRDGQYGLIEAE
ncbi:MAG: ribosome-associated translation inhibitor RaiA [Armatimonadota bacterium]|nr:ribosome-associated translation inhibitor RaiA [Armatimonadota bacterium]MDR5697802.1 ribosome-associated translation inhibitor RaiA [Armatimonadota bacterium]